MCWNFNNHNVQVVREFFVYLEITKYFNNVFILPRLSSWSWKIEHWELTHYFTGRHLKYVIENGKAKINNELIPTGRKIYLISGHENNVNNMLAVLNLLTSAHVPNYGNAIIFELHREIKTGEYGYKVRNSIYLSIYRILASLLKRILYSVEREV